MESVVLQLSGPEINETEIKQIVEVLENEDYHSALSRSLKKAQDDFNNLLTNIINENKRRHDGTAADKKAKKTKKETI